MPMLCSAQICLAALTFGSTFLPAAVSAQADMTCADYLKADVQMQASPAPIRWPRLEVSASSVV